MAQTGYTPISLYYSTTASAAPTAGNLANGELAININDGKLYYKDSGGSVQLIASKNGASGSVTTVSVVSANGFAGTVANDTTTPAITLTTSITGILKGNGTAISAAASGTDYAPATSGTSILYGNGSGGFSNVTIGTGLTFSAGTLATSGAAGTVTSVDVSGGTTGLTTSGGPVTSSGTITLAGTLAVANGGTGVTTSTGTGSVVLSTNPTLPGNLTFSGTGNRITGDFSNATVADRVMFQTSTVNGNTIIHAIPNGTGTVSAYALEEPAALTTGNSSSAAFNLVSSTDVRFSSAIRGTGTYLPMTFYTGGSERARFSTAGGFSVGTTSDPGAGAIYATGNITAYFSDDRLKNRLGLIENALDKLCSLDGFYYEPNETAQALGYEVKREVGVSAQQINAVLPEIVAPAPVDAQYMTVRYDRALPLIIEAIKELRAEVEALKKGN